MTNSNNSSTVYEQIAILDGQWHNELHYHTVDGTLPTKENARVLKFVLAILALTGLFVVFVNPNNSLLVSCLGFILFIFGTLGFFRKDDKFTKFEEAKREYENTRGELMNKVK